MKIITIRRQYGAGGREIGLAVGKELGVTLYDRDIIAATAKASSIDASQIEREGEEISATESILRNITPISYDQKDYIYETQRSVILDLAKQGVAILLISSDLPEIMAISDQILTMRNGEITCSMTREEMSEQKILQYSLGMNA